MFSKSIDPEPYSKIVYNLCAGVGTFLTGLGVIRYLDGYLKQKEKQRDLIQKQYPFERFKKSWDVIAPVNDSGRIFIRDLEKREIHHVGNYLTYLDIGLGSYKTNIISKKEFARFKMSEPIYTIKETDKFTK